MLEINCNYRSVKSIRFITQFNKYIELCVAKQGQKI